ncbi:MAG TPA: energy-coupling factor ABC transporter permease [Aquihabitans sp.]|nr:energy-coupling factor ABC transporter permease [Aquihabitans sp.]
MHIPDGYVSLPVSLAGAAVAATGVTVAARRAAIAVREKVTTLPAVVAAYLLVAQLLVVPVAFGTSAHLIGTGLATVLVGPAVAIVCVATVVVLQALVFADGGVTAIGLNAVNDGLVPALVAVGVVRALAPLSRRRPDRFAAVAGTAAALAALAGGLSAAAVLAVGGTDVVPRATVVATLGGAHVVVAGIEAALTAAIVATVLRLRPDLVALAPRPATDPTGDGAAIDLAEHDRSAIERGARR